MDAGKTTPFTRGRCSRVTLGLAIALVAGSAPAEAQKYGPENIGADLPISVILHPDVSQFAPTVGSLLEARVTAMVSTSGMAAVPGGSNFVLYPTLIPIRQERTTGQLRNQTVVTAEISLFLKNAKDGHLFGSMTRSVTGAGLDESRALMEAVSSLRPRDAEVIEFLQSARAQIVDFYDRSCDGVLSEGRAAAETGDYDRGLATLMAVPTASLACHDRASAAAVELVEARQQAQCARVVRSARAEVAADRFISAINALIEIDPSSPCSDEADALVQRIDDQVSEQNETELAEVVKRYSNDKAPIRERLTSEADVARRRLRIGGSVAVEYLNRRSSRSFDPSIFDTVGAQ